MYNSIVKSIKNIIDRVYMFNNSYLNIPSSIRIEACTICQLNCKSCYMRKNDSGTVGKGFLTFENFKKIIDENNNIKYIELSNSGEIFLNPQLLDIIKYAYQNGVELSGDNGVNFNTISDEMLESLVIYQFRSLVFSIDGASQNTYSQYRVGGNFDKVISNIKKLIEYKNKHNSIFPKLQWSYILMSHNECDVIKAKNMALELNIPIKFKTNWDANDTFENPELLKKLTNLKYVSQKEAIDNTHKTYNLHLCNQLFDAPQINWDGRLLGCCRCFQADFGINVFQVGLKKALQSKNYTTAKKMITGLLPPPKECKNIPCASCYVFNHMINNNYYLNRPSTR